MDIYLPIAEMSVSWPVILGMGALVGFLSGLLGVGGGFLLTPLLIFSGIPAEVAVATTASHLTASSMAGALAQWKRRAVDIKMAAFMLAGGFVGTAGGVYLLKVLRGTGQSDLAISGGYVVLLGVVGGLMFNESVRTLYAEQLGLSPPTPRTRHHSWIQGLPLKARFRQSKLYISVIPPIVLGLIVGILSAILGVGGGFIIVPAMIYFLRMPTNVVIGTSLLQIVVVTAVTTIFQAVGNYTVDIVLAAVLIVGGVIGAQFGVRLAARLRGEYLRLMLSILVLVVGLRLLWGLIATPSDLFSVTVGSP